ncbi:hypothetical protein [Pseudohongiella sp. O18]|uniref:hypothetical protein n=1 Tax=Pseudohongiella sp. O18 TaxID=2904248 RepID=UPI001F1F4453|nr:hypothetical protein [Pseudohongiella sp. O18]
MAIPFMNATRNHYSARLQEVLLLPAACWFSKSQISNRIHARRAQRNLLSMPLACVRTMKISREVRPTT